MPNDQNLSVRASHHASVDCFGLEKDSMRVFRAWSVAMMVAGGGRSGDVGWEMVPGVGVISDVCAVGCQL